MHGVKFTYAEFQTCACNKELLYINEKKGKNITYVTSYHVYRYNFDSNGSEVLFLK